MTEGQLSGFDTVELLGYGSGGEVWLARERATGLPVALKRLRAGADLAARDRLRREAAVLAGVDHPHVVRLRAVHGDGDSLVLVLDLAAGGSLARLLATRRMLPAAEVVTIAVPLAQALASVHAQGLVHGDVTPANVLFAADGRPMLSDLGISRLLGSPAAEVGGTGGYLDPAVVAGAAPGPASDVHGLAATCWAALTGLSPYDGHGRRVPVPTGVDRTLLDVLEPALAPDPADRPPAEQLAVAVFDAVPAEPVRLGPSARMLGGTGPRTGQAVVPATHQVADRRPAAEPESPSGSLAGPLAGSLRPGPSTGPRVGRRRCWPPWRWRSPWSPASPGRPPTTSHPRPAPAAAPPRLRSPQAPGGRTPWPPWTPTGPGRSPPATRAGFARSTPPTARPFAGTSPCWAG